MTSLQQARLLRHGRHPRRRDASIHQPGHAPARGWHYHCRLVQSGPLLHRVRDGAHIRAVRVDGHDHRDALPLGLGRPRWLRHQHTETARSYRQGIVG